MIERSVMQRMQKLVKQFPVLAVVGPRQSGKTTLIKEMFPDYRYINLENPGTLASIEADAEGFMYDNHEKIIIDEIQKFPLLMSYLQIYSDELKLQGNFIISGSENILLSEKVSQSLAGRAAYVNLYPFSFSELAAGGYQDLTSYEFIFKGGYPAVYNSVFDTTEYYNEYISTYIERDVKQVSEVTNLSLFRKFLALVAGRDGSIINYSSLSNDVGVDGKTIEKWISILEATYTVYRLQPYFENFGKRYTKSAKIYFVDTGVASRLLDISSAEMLKSHYLIGGLFENMCITEILKLNSYLGNTSSLFYFRDTNGNEVDLIIKTGEILTPIEIKSASAYNRSFEKGLNYFEKLIEKSQYKLGKRCIIYNGETAKVKNTFLYNWKDINQVLNASAIL